MVPKVTLHHLCRLSKHQAPTLSKRARDGLVVFWPLISHLKDLEGLKMIQCSSQRATILQSMQTSQQQLYSNTPETAFQGVQDNKQTGSVNNSTVG